LDGPLQSVHFCVDQKSKMTASLPLQNKFTIEIYLKNILKPFLFSETTEPFERKVGLNCPWMAQYSTTFMFLCTPEIQDGHHHWTYCLKYE